MQIQLNFFIKMIDLQGNQITLISNIMIIYTIIILFISLL